MPNIEHSIPIAAQAEAIYPLVGTASGFRQWWAEDVTESEGVASLGFFQRATIYRLRPAADQHPGHADWTCESGDEWGGTRIVFRLESRANGTLVRFTHGNWRAETEYFTACNTTWGELMYRLKAAAEGKPLGPLFLAGSLAY